MPRSTNKKEEKKKEVMTEEQKKEAGAMASLSARSHIEEACKKAGLTVEKVAQTVVKAMDAKKVVVQLDFKTGNFAESKEYADHTTRLKAVERAEVLLDLKPEDKHKVSILDGLSDEELDKRINRMVTGK